MVQEEPTRDEDRRDTEQPRDSVFHERHSFLVKTRPDAGATIEGCKR